MSDEKKSSTPPGRNHIEEQQNSEKYEKASIVKARRQCPKAVKDCSTCKITDCPEEEM
jgi:hypothetical protein